MMLRRRSFRLWLAPLAVLTSLGLTRSHADEPAPEGPVPYRVYQRDKSDRAEIPLGPDGAKASSVKVIGPYGQRIDGVSVVSGKLTGVPTGGPYKLQLGDKTIEPLFVGDLWVLAGQSNMEGVGDLEDVTPPHHLVMSLGMDGTWRKAEEPLHWLIDSPDPVHWPKRDLSPEERREISERLHKNRRKGSGLGLPFAVTMARATGVPVGLLPVAHGGTSMAQWDPAKKDEGGNSLYGSMLRQVTLAGGKVKGVLWYQGESDANPQAAEVYPKVFADFIAAVRKDFGQEDLPFYLVQIGRFIRGGDPSSWNAIREAERLIPSQVPGTAVVPTIDLELDDLIHIGTQDHKRLGRRLAWVALHNQFGSPIGTPLNVESVTRGEGNTIRVKFQGVDLGGPRPPAVLGLAPRSPSGSPIAGLQPPRHIAGFSIRQADGTEIPLIFDAVVDPKARDTVILQLTGPVPEKAHLWYGYGYDPYCNLADGLDMAAPAFGPVPLDEVK